MKRLLRRGAFLMVPAAAMALALSACGSTSGSSTSTTSTSSTTTTAAATTPTAPWGWPGTKTKGYLPPNEPHVKGNKGVKIGLITAGTIHDHGYYQSEVDTIDTFVQKNHWTTPIIEGSISPSNALSAAQNMCTQTVDLLIIGESELAAAAPAASTSVCKDTPVWMYASKGTATPSPYLHLAQTTSDPQSYITGVALGLWMKAHTQTTAGFIAGPALSFTERPGQAYLAGIRSVIPKANLDAVFTGSFTASGPAITAAQSMLTKGIKLIIPYLGGAQFPTAKYIVTHGGAVNSNGIDACSAQGVDFVVKQVFNPGYLLKTAMTQFAHGTMRVGVVHTFVLGKAKVPAVSFCPTAGVTNGTTQLQTLIKKYDSGQLTPTAIIDKTTKPS